MLEEKWANEVDRILDNAVKQSHAETGKNIAAEENIVKTCQYICSQYRKTMTEIKEAKSGSILKQQKYKIIIGSSCYTYNVPRKKKTGGF